MSRSRALVLTSMLWLSGVLGCAVSTPRVAMIVGNSQYEHTTALPNPANDATAMSEHLRKLGWKVITAIDLHSTDFKTRIAHFEAELATADQAIFFYAGHGIQIDGENFLVPIEFDPTSTSLERDLVSLNQTIDRFKRRDVQLAVFLDACRDNPFATAYEEAALERNRGLAITAHGETDRRPRFGRGLAELPASVGTFIAYSTAPGHVALDGTGSHSPFTKALLNHLDSRNQDVGAVLQRVRNEVVRETNGTQIPWDHSSLTESFWINPKQLSAPPP